jgi:hypothetical protein
LFQFDEWLIHHWSHNASSLPFFFNTQAGRRVAELIPTAREKRRAWMDREQSDRAIGILSRLPGFRKESLEEIADLYSHSAASSPSSRSVRHLALPPDFKNSSNSTAAGV